MRTVASRIQYRLQSSSSFHDKVNHIRQVLLNVLRSAANILEDGPNREAWNDLSPDRQMKLATSLMLALEENAFLLAGVSGFPQEVLETYESLSKYTTNSIIYYCRLNPIKLGTLFILKFFILYDPLMSPLSKTSPQIFAL